MSQVICSIWLYLKLKFKARCAVWLTIISSHNYIVFTVDDESLKCLNYE